ncbi:MAG: choice-of-anchor X domain-containing protein, partial [Thermoplasmata archaeon]
MSEVMGTMLILLITVVIFSSILIWVNALPAPTAARSVNFEGGLAGNYVGGIWQGASVDLVHLGGEDLSEGGTRVYLTIDTSTEALKTRGTFFDGVSVKTYGVEDADGVWRIGRDWGYLNESIPQGADVSVMVVDLDRGVVLWRANLSGVDGEEAPIFLDKWSDSDTSTGTRDPISPGDLFTVFARVIDPDDDLNPASVWAYLTFGTDGTPLGYIQLMDDGSLGDTIANDGIFTGQLPYQAQQNWDGGIIILNATDTGGRASATRLILRVGLPMPTGGGGFFPFGGTWNSTLGGIGQGDSGPSGDQGWNIYDEEGRPSSNNPAGTPTRTFLPGDTVYVIARSTVIQNVENINSFVLRDATGLKLYPPTKEFDSRDPTKTDPAFTQTLISPYFEYEYSFA